MKTVEELRKIAEQATPRWGFRERGHGVLREFEIHDSGGVLFRSTSYGRMEQDAAHIAAMNPAQVLALLSDWERMRDALKRIEEDSCDYGHDDIAGEALASLSLKGGDNE